MKFLLALISCTLVGGAIFAQPHSIDDKLTSALKSDIRKSKEIARDGNRKPAQTLNFFGLQDNMRVVELLPGGGWYTKLLAPILKDNGKYYAALGANRLDKLLQQPGFEAAEVITTEDNIRKPEGAKLYTLDNFSLKQKNLDMAFTFRNYHNFDEAGRRAMNTAVFDALKSGGIYAVVDHTRRHMQPTDSENRRRIDPVLAIHEIQQAGFTLVDYSTLHYRLDDELRYEVGRRSVAGNTDRFTLKFIKP